MTVDFGFRISDFIPHSEIRIPHWEKEFLMRGRRPSGPEFVDKLEGSPEAKLRAKTLLKTLKGTCRVKEACKRLGIKGARFDQLRIEGMQAMIDALERQPAGRRARTLTEAEQKNQQLEARVAELEGKLALAALQVELAVKLPEVVHKPGNKTESAEPSPAVVDKPAKKKRQRVPHCGAKPPDPRERREQPEEPDRQ